MNITLFEFFVINLEFSSFCPHFTHSPTRNSIKSTRHVGFFFL